MNEHFGGSVTIGTLARKFATARTLPPADLLLIAACWWTIGAAALVIALVPSRRVLRVLGPKLGAAASASANDPCAARRALRIARAIDIAARHAPFRADCYPQALAAAQLCRWFAVPHALHLGARFAAPERASGGRLEAHAWVSSGTLTLCGGQASARRFGTVACFVHTPRRGRDHTVR